MIQHNSKLRRLSRIRAKISVNIGIPRLSVFRSSKHIWAQIIDDKHGKTLVSTSSKTLKDVKGTKTEIARKVGEVVATLAKDKKVSHIRFDRGNYRYHGRIKALAEGARDQGLKF